MTSSNNEERIHFYTDLYNEIYILCDKICSFDEIFETFQDRLTKDELSEILNEFIENKLMISENYRYLALAVYCE